MLPTKFQFIAVMAKAHIAFGKVQAKRGEGTVNSVMFLQ